MPACSRAASPDVSPTSSEGYASSLPPPPTPPKPADDSFAVVELFSSEGCSSCPPVERAVDAQADRPGVFVLSFHVDYWDYLGHRDPYASAAATARQSAYVQSWGTHSTYTPMIVLDGAELGSGASELSSAIARARRPATTHVDVAPRDVGASPLVVELHTSGAARSDVLLVAAVERGLVQRPSRGENAGATLRHDALVRAWVEVPAASASAALDVPADAKRDALRIVAISVSGRHPTGAGAWPRTPRE